MLDLASPTIIIGFRTHCSKMGEAVPIITTMRLSSKSELSLRGRRRSWAIPLAFLGLQDLMITALTANKGFVAKHHN